VKLFGRLSKAPAVDQATPHRVEEPAVLAGPRPGWLRCAACDRRLPRDPLCSDLGILTLHWMSDHPARWLQLHPEDAAYI
jgi:hypothetical protein